MIKYEINDLSKNNKSNLINNKSEASKIINELLSLKNLFESIISNYQKEKISEKIKDAFIKINNLINLSKKLNSDFIQIENAKIKDEQIIRNIYGKYFKMKLLNDILEFNNSILTKTEKEYELLKEKTGAFYCNGKIICNERKENEIIILRTENSLLKNEIKNHENLSLQKTNIINHLNKQIIELNMKIKNLEKLKYDKNPSFSNINISINGTKNKNIKINNKNLSLVNNTFQVLSSNNNLNQNINSKKSLSLCELDYKLMNKLNKNQNQVKTNEIEENEKRKINTKNFIVVNKSHLIQNNNKNSSKNKYKRILKINKIEQNIQNNSLINKGYKINNFQYLLEKQQIKSMKKNISLNDSNQNQIHRKNKSLKLNKKSDNENNIKNKKEFTLLTESKKYNNIFPGFRLRNNSKNKEQNSKNNNSLPSSILRLLIKSNDKAKNSKKRINNYVIPYSTRRYYKGRNNNIIIDYNKSVNLNQNSFMKRTNDEKFLYNTNSNL